MAALEHLSYTMPDREKVRWVRALLGASDTELAHYLDISVDTLRLWQKDEADVQADELVRFHRLLKFIEAANGVIRADRLGHWIHTPNKALNGIKPATFLPDPAGLEIVLSLLDDLRTGAAA